MCCSLVAPQGFTAAFGLIFVSEIGDKTFFIAALLAMRRGRAVVMAGAVSALALMTGISVALGRLFTRLPDSFASSLPLGEYCAAALLLFFGVKALKDALAMPKVPTGDKSEADEMEEAAALVSKADAEAARGVLGGFIQTFCLIFVAEWGDRSMLATIALGAAQNPAGVFAGAVLGHALATLIAVVGGSLMSERISERTVGITGGVLFLVFAAATLLGVF
jgi:putative Ca2+/H+ antiporter (TMEM165/GDT1 family)